MSVVTREVVRLVRVGVEIEQPLKQLVIAGDTTQVLMTLEEVEDMKLQEAAEKETSALLRGRAEWGTGRRAWIWRQCSSDCGR